MNNEANEVRIELKCKKSSSFQAISVDGSMGYNKPNGDVHIVFYTEKAELPDKCVVLRRGEEMTHEIPSMELIREYQVEIALSRQAFDALFEFVAEKHDELAKSDHA